MLESSSSGSSECREGSLDNQVIVESMKVTPWQQNGGQKCHKVRAVRCCKLSLQFMLFGLRSEQGPSWALTVGRSDFSLQKN